MKRIIYFAMTTLTVLILLFGYHTSTSSRMAIGISAAAPVRGGLTPSANGGTAAADTTQPATGASDGAADQVTVPTTSKSATPAQAVPSASSSAESLPPTTSSTNDAGGSATTVTGSVADTRWGPVQLVLTVQQGKITDVDVVQYPNGNGRDQEINQYALPVLVQETLTAQSAEIDMVSGATVTSEGYLASLQSALDQAGM